MATKPPTSSSSMGEIPEISKAHHPPGLPGLPPPTSRRSTRDARAANPYDPPPADAAKKHVNIRKNEGFWMIQYGI